MYPCTASGSAQNSNDDCILNSTPLSQLQTVNNETAQVSLLPDYDRGIFFLFSQWIFPGIQFNCITTVSQIIVLGEPSHLPAPELTFWRLQNNNYDRVYRSTARPRISVAVGDSFDEISYNFEPALEVDAGVFIGFRFMSNSRQMQVTSKMIAFREGPSPTSIHVASIFDTNDFIIVDSSLVFENNIYFPLVSIVTPTDQDSTTPPINNEHTGASETDMETPSINNEHTGASETDMEAIMNSGPPDMITDNTLVIGLIAGLAVVGGISVFSILLLIVVTLKKRKKKYEIQ